MFGLYSIESIYSDFLVNINNITSPLLTTLKNNGFGQDWFLLAYYDNRDYSKIAACASINKVSKNYPIGQIPPSKLVSNLSTYLRSKGQLQKYTHKKNKMTR